MVSASALILDGSQLLYDLSNGNYYLGPISPGYSFFWLVDLSLQPITCPQIGQSYFIQVYNVVVQSNIPKSQYLLYTGNQIFRAVYPEYFPTNQTLFTVSSLPTPNSVSGTFLSGNGQELSATLTFTKPTLPTIPVIKTNLNLDKPNWSCITCPCLTGVCSGPTSTICDALCSGTTPGVCPNGGTCTYNNGKYECVGAGACVNCGDRDGKCPGACPSSAPVCLQVDGFYSCAEYNPCGNCGPRQKCIVERNVARCITIPDVPDDPCNCLPDEKCLRYNGVLGCYSNPCTVCPTGTTCSIIGNELQCLSDPCSICPSNTVCSRVNGSIKCIPKNLCNCGTDEKCVVIDNSRVECQNTTPCEGKCTSNQNCENGVCVNKPKTYLYWIAIGVLALLILILIIVLIAKK